MTGDLLDPFGLLWERKRSSKIVLGEEENLLTMPFEDKLMWSVRAILSANLKGHVPVQICLVHCHQ